MRIFLTTWNPICNPWMRALKHAKHHFQRTESLCVAKYLKMRYKDKRQLIKFLRWMTTLWVYSSSQCTQITTHLLLNCYATLCSRKEGFPYVNSLGGAGSLSSIYAPFLRHDTAPHFDLLTSPGGVLLGILSECVSHGSPNPDHIFQTKKCHFSHSF